MNRSPVRHQRWWYLLLIIAALAGCGGDRGGAGARASVVVADSAALRIGVLDGEPEYQFHRAKAARVLSDGRLVVADAGYRLRVYDADGRYLQTIGGFGGGPGEFRSIDFVGVLPGDSVLVQDVNANRVSVFASSGELARMFTLESQESGRGGRIDDILGTGELLVRQGASWAVGETQPGFRREPEDVYLADRDGQTIQDIGRFPGYERYFATRQTSASAQLTVTTALFARGSQYAAGRELIYVGNTAVPDIAVYNRAGSLVDSLDTDLPVRRVDEEALSVALEERLRAYSDENRRRDARRRFEEMPYPETLPVYESLLVDPLGMIWIREYRIRSTGSNVWRVYDPSSNEPAIVEFPSRFRISHVTEDLVAGIWWDSLDVPYVWVYELRRAQADRGIRQ
jgi:hypothetical protein